MSNKKEFLDIEDRQKCFQNISSKIELLNKGFRALNADYSHHIEVTYAKDHEITELRENIDYRLFSSQFHLELLLKQHFHIENRVETAYEKNPDSIVRPVYPIHPLFSLFEKETTSILDSIIFHLASVYDYLSGTINFICEKKDKSISKWTQLERSCRDSKNKYSQRSIADVILKETNKFINPLYKYRSRLIHEKSDLHPISLNIKMKSGKSTVKFYATSDFTKKFSELRKLARTYDITVNYAAEWLILSTIDSIFNILFSLKEEIEKMSTYPDHIGDNEIIILHRDPKTGIGEPVSKKMWKEIREKLNCR